MDVAYRVMKMKTSTKLIVAGAAAGVVIVAGALVARHFIKVNKENKAVEIIGGADGPTTIFLVGKIQDDTN